VGRPASASFPGTAAPTGEIVGWLAGEVCRRVGISGNDSVRSKLDKMAATLPAGEVGRWAERLVALDVGHPEWLSFVERLTVHETYFMRDPAQFDFVRRHALARIVSAKKARNDWSLRLWSAACSTGEEPYSLAILALESLVDAGEADFEANGTIRLRRPWMVEVLGSDLSRQAIGVAQGGTYHEFGLCAFRNLASQYRRFFERLDDPSDGTSGATWKVREEIRRLVRFQQFNLMSPQPPDRRFDVVFCRNVLIYFEPPGRRHVFKLMHEALNATGFAVFGPTDIVDDPSLFKPQWGPSTVIYQKI
jgi:chemotaxis protein methyltransferase CheR